MTEKTQWTRRGQPFPQVKGGGKTKYETDKETKDKIDRHVSWWNKTPLERAQALEKKESDK